MTKNRTIKIIDNIRDGVVNMSENIKVYKQEEVKTEGQTKKALIVLGLVAVGCAVYGFKVGRGFGYRQGAKDGIVHMSEQFIQATTRIAEVSRQSKGE